MDWDAKKLAALVFIYWHSEVNKDIESSGLLTLNIVMNRIIMFAIS